MINLWRNFKKRIIGGLNIYPSIYKLGLAETIFWCIMAILIPAYVLFAIMLYHIIATGEYWVASLIILSQYAAAKVGASLAKGRE
jgi:hypothetical protein